MNLTFGIVGCGRIAQTHARHMHANGRIVSVCDVLQERADKMAREYSATACYTIDDLLKTGEKPALVAICTPNGLHAGQSIRVMEAGIHVLCEKPMAINTKDCADMIK